MLGECYVPLAHKKNLHELLMSNSLLGVIHILKKKLLNYQQGNFAKIE
jgi:hypothetical protein